MSGYPEDLIRSLSNKLLTEERVGTRSKASKEYGTRTVIPHIHGIAHKLKRTVECSGGRVVFSAPRKLGSLYKVVK